MEWHQAGGIGWVCMHCINCRKITSLRGERSITSVRRDQPMSQRDTLTTKQVESHVLILLLLRLGLLGGSSSSSGRSIGSGCCDSKCVGCFHRIRDIRYKQSVVGSKWVVKRTYGFRGNPWPFELPRTCSRWRGQWKSSSCSCSPMSAWRRQELGSW